MLLTALRLVNLLKSLVSKYATRKAKNLPGVHPSSRFQPITGGVHAHLPDRSPCPCWPHGAACHSDDPWSETAGGQVGGEGGGRQAHSSDLIIIFLVVVDGMV